MIGLRPPALRLNYTLGAATIALAAIAAWPWLVPPVPLLRPLAAPPASTPAPSAATLPPLASYAAIIERPLFSPSRRPPPGAQTAQGPSIESRYRLVGIVATGPKKTAFIAEGAQRRDIAVGDMLDGWTVSEIGQDRIKLTSPAGEAVLKLAPAAAPESPKKP
jgi:general secretion pathway protein N